MMRIVKSLFMLIVFVTAVYFCTRNASAIVVDLLFTKIQTQVYMMMLAALIIGALLISFTALVNHARLKRQVRKLQKQHAELQSKVKEMEKIQETSTRESLPLPQTGINSR